MDNELRDILRTQRKLKKYTLEQLRIALEECGHFYSDKSTLDKWETGRTKNIPKDVIYALEEILDIPLGTMMKAADYAVTYSLPENQADLKPLKEYHRRKLAEIAGFFHLNRFNDTGENLLNDDELREQLDSAWERATGKYGQFAFECFKSHLDASLQSLEKKGQTVDTEKTLDVIETLAFDGDFVGKCDRCKDW